MQSVPTDFWQWISSVNDEQVPLVICLAALAAITVVLVVAVVSMTAFAIHRNRVNSALKREMLDRGMSAEEIAMVIQSRPAKSRKWYHRTARAV